jgi:hypothetical protein
MKKMDNQTGRIELNGGGFGSAARDTIEERAQEIAVIDHPDIGGVTEVDREKAREELMGQAHVVTTDDAEESEVTALDPSEAATDTGRRIKPIRSPSEQDNAENLTGEGVDEALHEQMLEAERSDTEEESP